MTERVLTRRLAYEISQEEVAAVAGGGCFHTPNTVCTTWEMGHPSDERTCDGGIDCDF
jgi:hypothetical protein